MLVPRSAVESNESYADLRYSKSPLRRTCQNKSLEAVFPIAGVANLIFDCCY